MFCRVNVAIGFSASVVSGEGAMGVMLCLRPISFPHKLGSVILMVGGNHHTERGNERDMHEKGDDEKE